MQMGLLIGGLWCGSPLQAQQDLHPEAQAESLECVVEPIRIEFFRDKEERKAWKIVAGRPVQYFAKKGDDSESFSWILTHVGANCTYQLQPIEPATLGRQGTLEIEILWNENKFFGPVEVKVNNGAGGEDEKDAHLFFIKEAVNPVTNNPNWFDFWQDNVVIGFMKNSIPKIKTYNINTCQWENNTGYLSVPLAYDQTLHYEEDYSETAESIRGTYGAHRAFHSGNIEIGVTSENNFCSDESTMIVNQHQPEILIWLGSGASKKKGAWRRSDKTLVGIHTYYSTLIHEFEHARIFWENWNNGFINILDADRDKYRDGWEKIANSEMDASNLSIKPYARFNSVLDEDAYQRYDPDRLFENPPKHSAGTEYEEWKARQAEYEIFSVLHYINPFDWSYDPPPGNEENPKMRNQGKQW
jgi:hypothetical protein